MNEKTFALPEPQLRVSDAERETVATRLREAATEGRLSLDEADERQTLAYAARTRDDLAVLTADLPGPPAPAPGARGALSPSARRRLAIHVAIVAVLAVGLVVRWAVIGSTPWFWPMWPMVWLAVSVLIHYRVAGRRAATAVAA